MNQAAESEPVTAPAPPVVETQPPSGRAGRLSRPMLIVAFFLWFVASVAGTLGGSLDRLPRDVSFSLDGAPVDFCYIIRADAVEEDLSLANQWCTPDEVLGPRLPDGIDTHLGEIQWQSVSWDTFVETLGQPDLWLTVGVGGSALLFFIAFAQATGTIRAGLAASISVVFLGLLLFPAAFTARIPADMRSELVEAWKWVILFYFGSEAAVQAAKIVSPGSPSAGGDLERREAPSETGRG